MTNPSRPSLESSVALRALVQSKRLHGKLTEALILARMGSQAAKVKSATTVRDGVSRLALQRYLELMPEDEEVRKKLLSLPYFPPPRRLHGATWLLLGLIGIAGVVGAAFLRMNGAETPTPSIITATPPNADSTPIVIRAVGDVVLGSDYPEHRLPNTSDKQRIAALHRELRKADIVVGNLEGVLSDAGKSRKDISKSGFFTFRMPTTYATTLREMGFDVLSLANNHSMDFGESGLESTVNALRTHGIAPMGVPTAEMAIITVRKTKVAFLNYSYLSTFTRMDDAPRIQTQIQQARAQADWVVVTVHAGKEGESAIGMPKGDEYFMNEYRGDLTQFAHLAINAGANAVFGHGPHVVRPYEVYQGKPIFYSLGNFVGYRSLSTKGKLAHSIVAEVRFDAQGKLLGAGIIPLRLDQSGIPVVDYSADNLQHLSSLLLERIDNRPVLDIGISNPVTNN